MQQLIKKERYVKFGYQKGAFSCTYYFSFAYMIIVTSFFKAFSRVLTKNIPSSPK